MAANIRSSGSRPCSSRWLRTTCQSRFTSPGSDPEERAIQPDCLCDPVEDALRHERLVGGVGSMGQRAASHPERRRLGNPGVDGHPLHLPVAPVEGHVLLGEQQPDQVDGLVGPPPTLAQARCPQHRIRPGPTPPRLRTDNRPPDRRWIEAISLARITGWRNGRTSAAVPSPTREVTPAAAERTTSESSQETP